ncbi:MAG: glycosyltransferase family 2 protein [Methyloligellaceae bacterium]
MTDLSVIILTCNEEVNLPVCLESLAGLGAEVFIVDSGSTDRTVEIAEEFGACVVEHEFENHAAQVNWALENLPIKTQWVMRLDADERITGELADELARIASNDDAGISGYEVRRRVYFWGSWIRFGGYYPTWLLRVWRHGHGFSEQRWMDEHIVLSQGKTGRLSHDIIDENQKGLSFWTEKHNGYADREVRDLLDLEGRADHGKLTGQASRKRWLKRNWYGRLPLFLRAFLYWFFRYFLLLGFLDGRSGLVFHFLQGFWYRFLVDAKLYEHKRKLKQVRL